MHFITVMCMKNLQAIILGFLKNSEFFNFKIKTLKKKHSICLLTCMFQ